MASAPTRETSPGRQRRQPLWLDICLEVGILVAVYLAYSLSRGSLHAKAAIAFDHARAIMDIENSLGIFIESDIQSFFLATPFRTDLANTLYTVGYYPLLLLFAIWGYAFHRDGYKSIRTAFVISALLAFMVFALFPMAPPRFFDGNHGGAENLGFVDTLVTHWHVEDSVVQAFYNPYAAMPSCHFAWVLMIGIGIWRMTKSVWAKALSILLPTATLVGIISTANHFILDAAGGATVTLVSLGLAALVARIRLFSSDTGSAKENL